MRRLALVLALVISAPAAFAEDPVPTATPAPTITATPSPTPVPRPFRNCTTGRRTGANTFLWKPVGEWYNGVVVLLPSEWVLHTDSVGIYTYAGRKVAQMIMRASGVCDPGQKECVYRPSFITIPPVTGAKFGRRYGSVVVRAININGSCQLWRIKRPANRVG